MWKLSGSLDGSAGAKASEADMLEEGVEEQLLLEAVMDSCEGQG